MVAVTDDILQRIADGSRAACHCKTCHTTLKGCHPILKHTLRGVGKASVDIAGITESETVCRMIRITEYVGGGLIDRHCACICCAVRLLLTYVKLKCLKV